MSDLQTIKNMKNHEYLVAIVKTAPNKAEAIAIARAAKKEGHSSSAWIQGWDDDEASAVQLHLYDSAGIKGTLSEVRPAICEECNPLALRV